MKRVSKFHIRSDIIWDSFVVSCNVSWRDTTSGRGPCLIDRLILQTRQTWWITLCITLCPLTAKFCLHLVTFFTKLQRGLQWIKFFSMFKWQPGKIKEMLSSVRSINSYNISLLMKKFIVTMELIDWIKLTLILVLVHDGFVFQECQK